MSWSALEEQAAELAEFGAGRLAESGVAYLATVDRSGAPRVHPVTPIVAAGRVFVFMEATSPKGRDLERGSRYALHAVVEDQDGGDGEFRILGTGRRIEDPGLRDLAVRHASYDPDDDYILFELLVDDAMMTVYADDDTPQRRRWRSTK